MTRNFAFQQATKAKSKARIMISGPSGSGKTTAALEIATAIGENIAVIDTENNSASLYSDRYKFQSLDFEAPYAPEDFVQAIELAENNGFDVIIVDGITPEWSGIGGCLDIQSKLGGRFQDWAKVTPRHRKFIDKILTCKTHIICTCRSKQGYVMDEKTKKVSKLGMAPEQRDGLDYEMTLVFDVNENHIAEATKDRTRLFDGKQFVITKQTGQELLDWLNSGKTPEPKKITKDDVKKLLVAHNIKDMPAFREKMLDVFNHQFESLDELSQEQLETLAEALK
jgi:predicted ABC-type ATPase